MHPHQPEVFTCRFDWIALLDVDEVIVPRKDNSWGDMMEEVDDHLYIIVTSFPTARTILTS